jgi:hypothetical protein
MLRTAVITALVIFHLAIFTIAARKAPRVIQAARRSRLIAGLGAVAVFSLAMVAISRLALHSRPLTLASAVLTMVSFILAFKLSARGQTGEPALGEPTEGSAAESDPGSSERGH